MAHLERSPRDAERLLERAARDVDRVIGPHVLTSDGLKPDPSSLTLAQRCALSRATCAAAEYRLTVGEDALVGDDEYVPATLQPLRTAGRIAPMGFSRSAPGRI